MRYIDNNDGTITDTITGLMWIKSPDSTTRTWQESLDYTNGLTLCGYSDWRLPNKKELRSLLDYSQYRPALPIGHPFLNIQSGRYWSSSAYAFHTGYAWYVYIWNGLVGYDYKSGIGFVLPVRKI